MPRDGHHRHRSRDPDRERDRDRHRDRDRDRDPDRDRERHRDDERGHQRRRQGHRATDSTGELIPRYSRAHESASESPSPQKPRRHSRRGSETPASKESGKPLSIDSLAKLDHQNYKKGWGKGYGGYDQSYAEEVRAKEKQLEDERKKEERRIKAEERKERDRERERNRGYGSGYESGYPDVVVVEESGDDRMERDRHRERRRSNHDRERRRRDYTESELEEKRRRREERREERRKRRVVSGPLLEEGGHDPRYDEYYDAMPEKRGGAGTMSYDEEEEERRKKKKKRIIIGVIVVLVALAIIIPVAVVVSNKKNSSPETAASSEADKPSNSNLDSISESDIPASAKGTILDPFSWYDTTDFNVTYTDETVGGLTIMGLNSTWDDDVQANDKVPNLKDKFEYGSMPIRGINIGGWLNIEPFITPSLFESYSTRDGVIDEWTLCTKLGSTKAASTLEKHYSSFVTRKTFEEIRAAGFDHVRIPYGYWAVTTYDGDPYVAKISWRYLLRGIEWARQNGLRVNLDLHGLPGSQNGWNHSGRQGVIGWLNGTDGDLNAQRSLDIHDQLSKFFAQDRYKNLVTMYGLANEPRMVDLNTDSVLNWYDKAISLIRKNKIEGVLVFGDGFMGLDNWQGKLQKYDNLLLDVHQYVIFNVDQLSLSHKDKIDFACKGWTQQSLRSSDKSTGFGPTMCGEWSQADTDCAEYINNVGWGTRWEGTYNTGNETTQVLKPTCPTNNNPTCSCTKANADPSTYSDAYKQWLLYFAIAQMQSFETGWGWFYWTWDTEKSTQWSWKKGIEAGILPKLAYDRSWNCTAGSPDFAKMGLEEYY